MLPLNASLEAAAENGDCQRPEFDHRVQLFTGLVASEENRHGMVHSLRITGLAVLYIAVITVGQLSCSTCSFGRVARAYG